MNLPSSNIFAFVSRAAELRVEGKSWTAIGAELGKRPTTVKRWANNFPEIWQQKIQQFQKMLAQDVAAEAILVLRAALRSDDEKIRRDAAKELLSFHLTHSPPLKEKAEKSSTLQPLTVQLEGLPDAELQRLLDEQRTRDSAT